MSKKIVIDNQTLLNVIDESIKNKLPLSVIRKGDGENVIIGDGACDMNKHENKEKYVFDIDEI